LDKDLQGEVSSSFFGVGSEVDELEIFDEPGGMGGRVRL
jgi:hypothetical protein